MKLTNKKGFTIVELVIVIAVIAILAAVLIPTFSGVVAKANASAAQQLAMNAVKAGLMMTNTATLPADTTVWVASNKKDIDYAYTYTGNELKESKLKEGNNYVTANIVTSNTILISDKSITGDTPVVDDLLATFLNAGFGTNTAKAEFTVTAPTDNTPGKITWDTNKTVTYYTSVDLPVNVILFVKMG